MTTKQYIILGLGNPGKEYEHTRHNTGRDTVTTFAKKQGFNDFKFNTYTNALTSEGRLGSRHVKLVLPETFVNKSSEVIRKLKLTKKDIEQNLLVIQDDLDLLLGSIKIVKNRGSGGHKGIESIMRASKTENFARIRIGIARKAQVRKSQSKQEVVKIVIGKFTPQEQLVIKKTIKKAADAIAAFVEEGAERAMNKFN